MCAYGRGGRGGGSVTIGVGWCKRESVHIFDLPGEDGICAQPIQNLCLGREPSSVKLLSSSM